MSIHTKIIEKLQQKFESKKEDDYIDVPNVPVKDPEKLRTQYTMEELKEQEDEEKEKTKKDEEIEEPTPEEPPEEEPSPEEESPAEETPEGGETADMGAGEEGMAAGDTGMGMGGEQEEEKLEPDEIGRVYELKKIHSRLLAIENELASSPDIVLLKLRNKVLEALDMFDVLIANFRQYTDKIDEIIILFYKFISIVYNLMKKYYEIKQKEEESDKKWALL